MAGKTPKITITLEKVKMEDKQGMAVKTNLQNIKPMQAIAILESAKLSLWSSMKESGDVEELDG